MRTVVVATAKNPADAQIWVDALRQDGIEAASFERGPGAAFGGMQMVTTTFPVVVAEDRLADARNVVAELGGAPYLAPFETGEADYSSRWNVLPLAIGVAAIVMVVVFAFMTA